MNEDLGFKRTVRVLVTHISQYSTFKEYLNNDQLRICLPGVDSLEEGEKVYYKYYNKEDELKFKILAIKFTVLD